MGGRRIFGFIFKDLFFSSVQIKQSSLAQFGGCYTWILYLDIIDRYYK